MLREHRSCSRLVFKGNVTAFTTLEKYKFGALDSALGPFFFYYCFLTNDTLRYGKHFIILCSDFFMMQLCLYFAINLFDVCQTLSALPAFKGQFKYRQEFHIKDLPA